MQNNSTHLYDGINHHYAPMVSSGFVLQLRVAYTGENNRNSKALGGIVFIEWFSVNDICLLCEWHTITQSDLMCACA